MKEKLKKLFKNEIFRGFILAIIIQVATKPEILIEKPVIIGLEILGFGLAFLINTDTPGITDDQRTLWKEINDVVSAILKKQKTDELKVPPQKEEAEEIPTLEIDLGDK